VRGFLALTRRELGAFFVSPVAYIVLTAILLITGAVFASLVKTMVEASVPFDFSGSLAVVIWLLVITSALVTMRLVAEEKSRGTIEIALTAPVTESQWVLSKFAASMVLLLFLALPSAGFVLLVSRYAQVDAGAVACGYLGVVLVGALAYAVGLFVSTLCSNQITAGIITFTVSFFLLVTTILAGQVPASSVWWKLVEYVDLSAAYGDFIRGVIDLRRLVYLLSGTAFFLFLSVRVVETRRWR
jgi:ABC-2 type transport system permease protein